MKRIASLIVFCCVQTLIGGLLSVNIEAQQKSSNNQKELRKNRQRIKTNQKQTDTPVRTPEQLAVFQRLIEQAMRNGTVRFTVGVRDFAVIKLLEQLKPFQVEVLYFLGTTNAYIVLRANVAALIFMRDSNLVENVAEDMLLHTSTTGPPLRTSQQLAVFQRLNE